MARVAKIGGGVGLMLAGAAMLVLPGPGLLTLAAGATLLRDDIPVIGRLLDTIRSRLPAMPLLFARA